MRDADCFICIDAGTTRFKAALISPEGKIRAKREFYYPSAEDAYHEYRPGIFAEALEATLKPLLGSIGKRRAHAGDARCGLGSIRAVGITGHGPTLIPVDRQGTPLGPGVGYLDDRVRKQINELSMVTADRLRSSMYVPIALYFKQERSGIYKKTHRFLQSFDYVAYLVCGSFAAAASSAGIKPWDGDTLKQAGLDPEKFPAVKYMGEQVGRVSKTAAERFSIPGSLPVYAIGVDFAAALAGTDTLRKGSSCERSGSSGGINLCWDRGMEDKRLLSYGHFVEGLFNIAGITSTSGKALEWAEKALGCVRLKTFRYDRLPKKIIFYPYLKGERTPLWDPSAKGAFIGLQADHTKEDLIYAVRLGIVLALRDCIGIIEENGGSFDFPIVTTGWGAKNDAFTRFKSDATGKGFAKTQSADAELLGIAAVCAAAEGYYPNLESAAGAMVRIRQVFEPNRANQAFYDELFGYYREIRDRLLPYYKLFDE